MSKILEIVNEAIATPEPNNMFKALTRIRKILNESPKTIQTK